MKPNLILHIGTEKTGTTSLQKLFALNRTTLSSQSIYIPTLFGSIRHRRAEYAFECSSREDGFSMRNGLYRKHRKKRRFKSAIKDQWRQKVSEHNNCTWIISSEHFQSRLTSKKEIISLWSFLSELYDNITIIAYLRDPVQAAISSLSTAVRSGIATDLTLVPGGMYDNACDHKSFLSLWLSVIPRHHFVVRLYDHSQFLGGDLFFDFFSAAGLDYSLLLDYPPRCNQSLSYPALRLLAEINKILPPFIDGLPNPGRRGIDFYIEEYFSHYPPLRPTRKLVSMYDKYYHNSFGFLRKHFFQGMKGRLWKYPELSSKYASKYLDLMPFIYENEAAKLLVKVWKKDAIQ